MKIIIIILLTIVFTPLYARKLAIVVGVGAYTKESGLLPLTADNDTKRLETALKEIGWEVYLINCQTPEKPDMSIILKSLGLGKDSLTGYSEIPFTGILSNLSASDEVLFFFGGHGVTNLEGSHCLVPLDAQFDSKTGRFKNEFRLISIERIKQSLSRSGALVMVIIDACRNNVVTARAGASTPGSTPIFTRSAKVIETPVIASKSKPEYFDPRIAIILSTRPGFYSHEMQQSGSGVFTHFLIELLTNNDAQDEADNQPDDGIVSINEAFLYIKEQTRSFVASLNPNLKKSEQIPEEDIKNIDRYPFVEVEAKRLSDPRYMLEISILKQKRPLSEYQKPGIGHKFEYIPTYFRVEKEPGEGGGKILEFNKPQDKYSISDLEFDGRFLATQDWSDPDEFFFGLKPYQFYFPKEILEKLMAGRHRLSFDAIRFHAFKDVAIKGYCIYTLDGSTEEVSVDFKGRDKNVKVWKITQKLEASNDDPCHPLKVRAFRTYYVLKNLADPLILKMESHYCFYIEKDRISPDMKYCRSVLKEEVDYTYSQVTRIFIKQ